jgi:hypothetical protein
MKYSPYLRVESAGFRENRVSSGALSRPIDRDIQRLIALLEGAAERDRSRIGNSAALQGSVGQIASPRARAERATYRDSTVPVLWEPEAEDTPTSLFYPTLPRLDPRTAEDRSSAKQRRRQAVWQFFLAFGSAALMVSVLPAALWVAGLLPRNEPNAVAAPPPPGVAVSRPSSPAAPPSAANPSRPVAASNASAAPAGPNRFTTPVSPMVSTAAARPAAMPQRAPRVHSASPAVEANVASPKMPTEPATGPSPNAGSPSTGAPADLANARHPQAPPTSAPRTDVARSL